jgi:hypothetical protein
METRSWLPGGLFPAQLKEHEFWLEGAHWLQLEPSMWPEQLSVSSETIPEEERSVCLMGTTANHLSQQVHCA